MNYSRSVAITWQTTVDRLSSGAFALLRILTWVAAEPVPQFVFESETAESVWEKAARFLKEEQAPEHGDGDLLTALSDLASYSMVQWDAESQNVLVHRVVQDILRGSVDEESKEFWVTRCLALLNAAVPGDAADVRNWPRWDSLLPHVSIAIKHADEAGAPKPTTVLMGELAQLLKAKGRHDEAEPLMRRALELDEESYGPDHTKVAVRLNHLATLLQETNRSMQAEPLMRRALEIAEANYGPADPNIVSSLVSLGLVLQITNRLDEAEELCRRALEINESSYGPEHPEVASSLSNLAFLLRAKGRFVEAEELWRRALEIAESSFGPDHPVVARQLGNLANLLKYLNSFTEAEALMRRALEIVESSYGPDHPKVAIHLNHLAFLLQDTDRLTEVEPLMRRAIGIEEGSLGPDHPDVAPNLNNLALFLQSTNRLTEAEPPMRRQLYILFKASRRTGVEHRFLRTALGNYSRLLKEMGRGGEARRPPTGRQDTAVLRRHRPQLGPPKSADLRDEATAALGHRGEQRRR